MKALVTCQYRADPHELDDECVNVTNIWLTHATRRVVRGEWRYEYFDTPDRLRIFYGGAPVAVALTEAADGYYGWLTTGAAMPSMIRYSRAMFSMQFPYGYQGEEDRGRGRMLRLQITERCE